MPTQTKRESRRDGQLDAQGIAAAAFRNAVAAWRATGRHRARHFRSCEPPRQEADELALYSAGSDLRVPDIIANRTTRFNDASVRIRVTNQR